MIIYILLHREKYGTILTSILNIINIVLIGIIYSSLFIFSIIIYYSEIVNLLLWKLSLIFGFLAYGINGLIYSFLKKYKNLPIIPLLCYTTLLGLLIGSLFFPDSILIIHETSYSPPYIITDPSNINFIFNISTGLIVVVFQILIIIYFSYISLIIHFYARDRKISIGLIIIIFIFLIPILMFITFIFFQLTIFRELYIFFIWINLFSVCVILIKNPETFIGLTNKIYYIGIYHKSGVLLFSYKFEKGEKVIDSTIWGNILIGINHILSEFIDKGDQIDVMQTKNSEIVVNYENEYGFAVLVITNQKNAILTKVIEKFTIEFKIQYKNELNEIKDLNKIINVSEFADTKEIIEKNFKLYL